MKAGFTFLGGNDKMLDQANLAGALGTVEVRPIDMTTAFGAFGNGGKVTKPRYILKVVAPDGTVIYEAGKPITKQVWKPSTAHVMAGILDGNTNRAINPAWGAVFEMHNTRDGSRRPAAIKTGTTNELKDYSTYGILPMPRNRKQPALAVGVWYGNSDSSSPNLGLLRYSMDNAGQTWVAFMKAYMKGEPAPGFRRLKGGHAKGTSFTSRARSPAAHTRRQRAPKVTTPVHVPAEVAHADGVGSRPRRSMASSEGSIRNRSTPVGIRGVEHDLGASRAPRWPNRNGRRS